MTQRFCRWVHRQAMQQSEFGVEYRRRKKEEILPVIIAGIIRFLCLVYGLKFGNVKRLLYIKFILLFCILSVRRSNVITCEQYRIATLNH